MSAVSDPPTSADLVAEVPDVFVVELPVVFAVEDPVVFAVEDPCCESEVLV